MEEQFLALRAFFVPFSLKAYLAVNRHFTDKPLFRLLRKLILLKAIICDDSIFLWPASLSLKINYLNNLFVTKIYHPVGSGQAPVLYFNQTVSKLDVEQERDWAKQFPVEGREAVSLICEFLRKPRSGFVFSAGNCDAILEGKFDDDKNWKVIGKFKLHTPEAYLSTLNSTGPLIPYDNDPDRESQ